MNKIIAALLAGVTLLAGINLASQSQVPVWLPLVVAPQGDVKDPGRNKLAHTKSGMQFRTATQDIKVGQQLQLQSVIDEDRIQVFLARLVIDHNAKGFAFAVQVKIDAIDPAVELQFEASVQLNRPGRGGSVTAEGQFNRGRIELILLAHPADQRFDKILQ